MLAFLILFAATLSRLIPHSTHLVTWNFTALGGGLLFFGSRLRGSNHRARPEKIAAKLAAAMVVLAAADYCLTVYVFGFPWHTGAYLVTWSWYAAVCLIGMELLEKPGILRCAAATVASATSFFLLSNSAVWMGGEMYPHTLAGLGTALAMGLPFYRNDLVSTALTVSVLFGLPAMVHAMKATPVDSAA